LTAPGIGDQLTVIREIRRQQTVQRLENQQGVLEDDSFADQEPMKLLQDQSDVVLALFRNLESKFLHRSSMHL